MACFLVPMAEAIVVNVAKKIEAKKERKDMEEGVIQKESSGASQIKSGYSFQTGLSWSRKLSWLNNLLWGGVLLLALEHLWHGEIVPWPPFLTAMNNPDDIAPMLHEIATIGTSMAIFVTIVWGILAFIADQKAKQVPAKAQKAV